MRTLASSYDQTGRATHREMTDAAELPLADDQRRHLGMGLEVTLISAKHRLDVRPLDVREGSR